MHLRRAGYFVLAALTLPFDFEGRRKVEEAAALVEALQDVANLVVGVDTVVALGLQQAHHLFRTKPGDSRCGFGIVLPTQLG